MSPAGTVEAAGCDSVDRTAGRQIIDAFHMEQAGLSKLLTFTKCCLGDHLIEPSFSDLKPLSMEP